MKQVSEGVGGCVFSYHDCTLLRLDPVLNFYTANSVKSCSAIKFKPNSIQRVRYRVSTFPVKNGHQQSGKCQRSAPVKKRFLDIRILLYKFIRDLRIEDGLKRRVETSV